MPFTKSTLRIKLISILLYLILQSITSKTINRSKLRITKQDEIPSTKPPKADTTKTEADDKCQCEEENHTPESARIAYAITAHNDRTINDAYHLFRTIRSSTSSIIIHIDTKYNYEDLFAQTKLYKELHSCPCGSTIHHDSVYSSKWGEWSMNEPTHWTMNVLLHHPKFRNKWDVYVNLSGDSLLVYKHSVISKLLGTELKGINFVTSSGCETGLVPTNVYDFPKYWHKREHYTEEETVPMPNITYYENNVLKSKVITTYFGSQWMILTKEFLQYLIPSLDNPNSLPYKYKQYLIEKQRLMTDETFIPSLIVAEFPHTLPNVIYDHESFIGNNGRLKNYPIKAIRYERMDEHVPKVLSGWYPSNPHYIPVQSNVDKPHVWGPYYLGIYDLHDIKTSGALFIRKVSYSVDQNMYRVLPVDRKEDIPDIGWVEVEISEVPDWEREKARLIEKAKKRIEAEKKDEEQEIENNGDDGEI